MDFLGLIHTRLVDLSDEIFNFLVQLIRGRDDQGITASVDGDCHFRLFALHVAATAATPRPPRKARIKSAGLGCPPP